MPRSISPRVVAAARRLLGSLLPRRVGRRHDASRLIRPWSADSLRSYPTIGLTGRRLLACLQAADAGQPQMQFELFEDMLQKWPRLAAVAATRRLALTGLEWEIVPPPAIAAGAQHDALARQVADFCRQTLLQLEHFHEVLDHLASAIGYGVALAELVWERGRLVDIVPVPHCRLIGHPHDPWRLCVLTEDQPAAGLPIDQYRRKWIVHRPRHTPGHLFDGGLLRASAALFLAQNLSFKDWLIYSQIAGMPVRVAQFEPGLSEDEQRRLLKMLESLGTDAVAVFSKSIDLRLIETQQRGARPYQPLQDYCNTEVTILWLGQHLTTDVKSTGSRAAAQIHDRVREDLLADDIADEGYTLRRDLLTPLVEARFGAAAPVPLFRRSLSQAVDTRELADTLAIAVNDLGLAVPRVWVHHALGIPQAQGDDLILDGRVNQ